MTAALGDSKSEPENAGQTYASLFAHIAAEQGGRQCGQAKKRRGDGAALPYPP